MMSSNYCKWGSKKRASRKRNAARVSAPSGLAAMFGMQKKPKRKWNTVSRKKPRLIDN